MKKYEYKFVKAEMKLGLDYSKKIKAAEAEWNQLGAEGWQFCKEGNGVLIFYAGVGRVTKGVSCGAQPVCDQSRPEKPTGMV